jgi:hypothetical protein
MLNIQLIHTFLKDPLTEKLINRYVTSDKVRKALDTTMHVVEVLVVAMPLIEMAVKSVKDMVSPEEEGGRRRGSRSSTNHRHLPQTAS